VTTLPLKLVKLLPDLDVRIGGVKAVLRDDDYELTLLCEAQVVRFKPRKPRPGDIADARCIPLASFAEIRPAQVEAAQPPVAPKK
jgi:hypothetical protein